MDVVFVHGFGLPAPQTLGLLGSKGPEGVLCYVTETLDPSPGLGGLVARGTSPVILGLKLPVPPLAPTSSSLKTPADGITELPGW